MLIYLEIASGARDVHWRWNWLERARRHHPAGIRTHTWVAIGAAVVMLLGGQTAACLHGPCSVWAHRSSRGIGFLGAGDLILKEGRSVRGLTTSGNPVGGCLLGLAMGAGQYAIAIGGFLVSMISLRMFKMPRYEISLLCSEQAYSLEEI